MKLSSQRRLAAQVLGVGINRVWFDKFKLPEIKEAITKVDIKNLISKGLIKARLIKGISKFRVRKIKLQKRKGRRKGVGSKKGTKGARVPKKRFWITKVRLQRSFIKKLKLKKRIAQDIYKKLYRMIKGNFFRSERHIKIYMEEHNLFQK